VFGTPLAYLLARRTFPGKRILESVIDLPIMIPHPVVGIALLSIAGRNHPIGRVMQSAGIQIMGTVTGMVAVLTFVGLPFYINTVKAGFEEISPRLEHRLPQPGGLGRRHLLPGHPAAGLAAHGGGRDHVHGPGGQRVRRRGDRGLPPMVAPVMIYERFTAYGLKYSQPVAVWLILVCLVLFLLLRIFP
jgi:molybdate/tungstate transport system permease protein